MKSFISAYGKTISLAVAAGAVFYLLMPATAFAAGSVDVCAGDVACDNFINKYINPAIVALTALIGVGAVISIIIAGIQYSASADDPGAVSKAKQRIFNTLLGLVAYIFLFAFLSYMIPGGIL